MKVNAATNSCWENVRVNEASPEIPACKLVEVYYSWWWFRLNHMRIFINCASSFWVLVIPVVVKHNSSVNTTSAVNAGSSADGAKSRGTVCVFQVHPLVTVLQTEYDRDTTAALVIYSVQEHGRYLFELQDIWYWWKAVFQQPREPAIVVVHYIQTMDDWHPITFIEMLPSLRVGSRQKGNHNDLTLSEYYISLYMLMFAYPLHTVSTRCFSTNSVNE